MPFRNVRALSGLLAAALLIAACGSDNGGSGVEAAEGCDAIAEQYSALQGQTLRVAANSTVPPFSNANPDNPEQLEGFDVDLINALAACLGMTTRIQPQDFTSLIPSIQSGRADAALGAIYATDERAEQATFLIHQVAQSGGLVQTGNPEGIETLEDLCGKTAAEVSGYFEVQLLEQQSDACIQAGEEPVEVLLFQDNDALIDAVIQGRADITIVNLQESQRVAEIFDELDTTLPLDLPVSIGIPLPKENTELQEAMLAALQLLQSNGDQDVLMAKWGLSDSASEDARLLG